MLRIEGVSKKFGKPVLEQATMSVEAGTGALLSAPNGAGKSTLLKMVMGIVAPDSGYVMLDGQPVRRQLRRLGYCPSGNGGFYPRLTARQNLHYFGALQGLGRRDVEAALARHDFFAIDYWDIPIEKLSDGMLQKAKILRALLHDPGFLVLDEPLNFLDTAARTAFLGWLETWRQAAPARGFLMAQHQGELRAAAWTIRERRLEAGMA